MCLNQFCHSVLEKGVSALVIREVKGGTEEGWWGCVVMGGGRAWGCVKAMISADQATLLLIGTVETLGCLPPHSNEKPWPPLVSKVTKAYCNCTFSNGVSHARTPTPVMTITIMSLGSTGAFQSSVTLVEGMLVSCCWRFEGCNIVFDSISPLFSAINCGLFILSLLLSFFLSFLSSGYVICHNVKLSDHFHTGFVFRVETWVWVPPLACWQSLWLNVILRPHISKAPLFHFTTATLF